MQMPAAPGPCAPATSSPRARCGNRTVADGAPSPDLRARIDPPKPVASAHAPWTNTMVGVSAGIVVTAPSLTDWWPGHQLSLSVIAGGLSSSVCPAGNNPNLDDFEAIQFDHFDALSARADGLVSWLGRTAPLPRGDAPNQSAANDLVRQDQPAPRASKDRPR